MCTAAAYKTDGFYFGRSWKLVQHLLSHPELLERPLKEEIDFEF